MRKLAYLFAAIFALIVASNCTSPIPAPPSLVNPQNPVTLCGADNTGVTDATSCFQTALNTGDVLVPAGHYLIGGHLSFNRNNQHMQCVRGSSNNIVAFLQTTSQSAQMIDIDGRTNDSIFYCGFRGPNADIAARTVASLNGSFFIRVGSVGGSNNQIVQNDFNGIGGFLAAINIYAADNTQPPPDGTIIAYNTFEHCGYYAVQATSSTNARINHNTMNDCSGMIEPDDTGQANTGNIVDSNHMTFTFGVGCRAAFLSGCNGFDGLTCGAAPPGFNFGGDTCSNNVVDGTHGSTICQTSASGCAHYAVSPIYTNNTCTGGCVLNNYNQ